MMSRDCEVGGCHRKHYGRGLCSAHYYRVKKTGKVKASKPVELRNGKRLQCKANRCVKKGKTRGWCANHYRLVMRRKKKERLVEMFGGVCVDCNEKYPPLIIQFHHRLSRYKKFEIGPALLNIAWSSVVKEAKKCDMLCPTCHSLRHAFLRDEELGYDPFS